MYEKFEIPKITQYSIFTGSKIKWTAKFVIPVWTNITIGINSSIFF